MNEPTTPAELQCALESIGCGINEDGERWYAIDKKGAATGLDAEDESSALFEAWNLLKP